MTYCVPNTRGSLQIELQLEVKMSRILQEQGLFQLAIVQ
jgi:hypothetical protein